MRGVDIAGLAVNIAKRVCDLAEPGEMLVTRTVTDHVSARASRLRIGANAN